MFRSLFWRRFVIIVPIVLLLSVTWLLTMPLHKVFAQGGLVIPSTGSVTQPFLGSFTLEKWYTSYYDQHNVLQTRPKQGAHSGVDISNGTVDCSTANPVYAAASGTVIWAGFDPNGKGFGWSVVVSNGFNLGGNGYYTYTLYGHMGTVGTSQKKSTSCLQVQVGQQVNPAGSSNPTILGYQGSSGLDKPATHVHFTIFAGTQNVTQLSSPYVPNAFPASPDFYTCLALTQGDSSPVAGVSAGQNGCSSGGTWSPTGSLFVARFSPRLTRLQSGMVLLEGGNAPGVYTADSELFNPATGTWTQTGNLNVGRTEQTATLLPNGEVLISGGYAGPVLNSAELYDPGTGTWTLTGSMNQVRTRHTATLLPNGKVLVAGGWNGGMTNTAELYDPSTGSWSMAASMLITRADHTATLLPNGKVLIAGGAPDNNLVTGESELYDPATDTWSATGSMNVPRAGHTAVLLPNGKVLVVGGSEASGAATATAELYDPTTGTWTLTGSMSHARSGLRDQDAQLLNDGTVLMAGGDASETSEIYTPASGTWSTPLSMGQAHCAAGTAMLSDGRVLIAAGDDCVSLDNKSVLAELYTP